MSRLTQDSDDYQTLFGDVRIAQIQQKMAEHKRKMDLLSFAEKFSENPDTTKSHTRTRDPSDRQFNSRHGTGAQQSLENTQPISRIVISDENKIDNGMAGPG